MKCDACGAPVENGKCTYCGKVFQEPAPSDGGEQSRYTYERPTTINITNVNSASAPNSARVKKNKKRGCGTTIVGFIVICVFIGILGNIGNSKKSSSDVNSSVWATEVTSIDNFDYYLDGDNVYLQEYKGHDKKIKIATSYTIDGKEYKVADKIGALFVLKSVDSVILPEGIVSMPDNTFNSCGVKYVYIPKSLQPGEEGYSFYDYFHDVEKIYYGGSEDEWHILTNNADRADIDATEIVYNANLDDLQ